MNRRLIASTLLVAASLLSASSAFASTTTIHAPVNAFFGAKSNLIKFTVRNDSASEVKLKAADSEVTIAPGKSADMKVANGTQVIAVAGTSHDAGSVIATVSDALKGNTLVVR